MNSYTVLDPLGAQAIRRPRHLSGRSGEDVLMSLLATISKFNCFLLCCAILIISCTHKHFCLTEGVSEEMANIIFNKATRKVLKDIVKHAHLVSTASYYSQVLKQPIKPNQVQDIYMIKEQQLQWNVDLLIKYLEVWDVM
jgi:hypothetical protein